LPRGARASPFECSVNTIRDAQDRIASRRVIARRILPPHDARQSVYEEGCEEEEGEGDAGAVAEEIVTVPVRPSYTIVKFRRKVRPIKAL